MRIPAALLCLWLALPALAAVEGMVHNGTTGNPQPGVEVTLLKLDQGMVPVGSVKTDSQGKFRFEQSIANAEGQVGHALLRVQFEGVTYSEILPPGSRSGDVKLHVYTTSRTPLPPEQRVLLVEPSGAEMVVNESYLFRNQSQPPVAYVNPGEGTLRFYLPAAANGVVQVNVAGVAGVPLRINAEKTSQPDVYQVDYPVKPGESRIDVTYRLPYQSPLEFIGRTLYPNVAARIAVPPGVKLEGDRVQSLGEEPQSKASIFNLGAGDFRVTISGQGQLARGGGESGEAEGGGGQTSIIPAAVQQQRWVIFGFAAAILALGFYGLYAASGTRTTPASTKKRKT